MFSTDVATAAAHHGISPEQLVYLNATANQVAPSTAPQWAFSVPPYVPAMVTPYGLTIPPSDIPDVDMDTSDEPPTAYSPAEALASPLASKEEVAPPARESTASPTAESSAPPRPAAKRAAPAKVPAKRTAPAKAPVPTTAAAAAPKHPPARPASAAPTAGRGPSASPAVSDPKLVIDFGTDTDESDVEAEAESRSKQIEEGISTLLASARPKPSETAQPETARKMSEMATLRNLIAQKEKELEEKRRAAAKISGAGETAVVKRANAKRLQQSSRAVVPEAKRQKTTDESEISQAISSPAEVNLVQVKTQVSTVFAKEEALRQQLRKYEAAQLDLVSLQRSMVACKSERSHLESRIRILEDHIKQARLLFGKVVAKEHTLQVKLSGAEKKVSDRRKAMELAETNLSVQRIQLQETEIDLGVQSATLTSALGAYRVGTNFWLSSSSCVSFLRCVHFCTSR